MLLMNSLVHKAEERISEVEERSLGTSQTEIQKKREREEKKNNRASKNCRKFQRLQHTQNGTLEDREKGGEEKIKVKMTDHF